MAAKDDSKTDTGTQEKARHLSEEALEERNRGNKEEADFVLNRGLRTGQGRGGRGAEREEEPLLTSCGFKALRLSLSGCGKPSRRCASVTLYATLR